MLEGPARITDYSSGCSQAGEKTDVKFCPDVRFGCSVHRMMRFLIQKKAGEQSSRLRLCTRGIWGEGAVGSRRFAREGGTGAKHSTAANRDLFVGGLCHGTQPEAGRSGEGNQTQSRNRQAVQGHQRKRDSPQMCCL